MAIVTAGAEVRAEPAEVWSLWTEPSRMRAWLPVSSELGPLSVGASFSWRAQAPFVIPVGTTGRGGRLQPNRVLELEIDMRFSPVDGRPGRLGRRVRA